MSCLLLRGSGRGRTRLPGTPTGSQGERCSDPLCELVGAGLPATAQALWLSCVVGGSESQVSLFPTCRQATSWVAPTPGDPLHPGLAPRGMWHTCTGQGTAWRGGTVEARVWLALWPTSCVAGFLRRGNTHSI